MERYKMKVTIAALIATIIFSAVCFASPPADTYTNEKIVNAIWFAEGADKATYPYGIRSVSCEGLNECRQVCLNSVRNGRARWIKAGKPYDLITFIGLRYSPPDINPNWVRLVNYFLEKELF